MRLRPVTIVIIICLLGMVGSVTAYLLAQNRVEQVFTDELDVRSLQRMTENGDSFLVYFYGRSCADCAASEPYLVQALAEAQTGGWDIAVYKCERDANATVRSLYGVEGTPTLIYFYQGGEAARLEGPRFSVEEYLGFFAEKAGWH